MNVLRFCMGFLWLASASAAVVGARSERVTACAPTLESAWVRAAPPGAPSLAGYVVLRNGCDAPVTVTGVESLDFARPMIHRSVDEGGVARMRPAGDLVVPAGGELRFEPGGLHLMLMQPKRPLADGDTARVRLVLADGRRLFAEFAVRRAAP
jgi:copper(I)-binding protein